MLTANYPFTTPGNYTYDSDKIDVSGDKAQLKLTDLPDQSFTEQFNADTGFTYDSDLSEFVGGLVRQKNQANGASAGAIYNSDINLIDWSDGVVTGVETGGAAVSGGKLDLTGGTTKRVDYDASGNADSVQTGCIRLKVTPNYSGAPANDQWLFCIARAHNDVKNVIQLRHSNSGAYLRLHMYDKDGNFIVDHLCGTWSPVAGTEYEMELNWDLDSGETRLFIDGVQTGTTFTGTATRDSNIGLLRIGDDYNGGSNADFKVDDLVIFPTVQHTANYTAGYTIPEYKYLSSSVILPEMEYTGAGFLQVFQAFSITGANEPRFTLQVGRSGNYLYWDGAEWVTSDGSYSQANDATTFNANLGDLDIEGETYGQFKILFDNGNSQMNVAELTAVLTGQTYPVDSPSIKPNVNIDTDSLQAFTSTLTEAGNDTVKFVLEVDGTKKYWNGTAWATSSGAAQSNTADEINTNISSLDVSLGAEVVPVVYLYSDNGTTTPDIDDLSIGYDFFSPPDADPTLCTVYGYVLNQDGTPLEGATIKATLQQNSFIADKNFRVQNTQTSTTTNVNGYFEIDLIRSSEYETELVYDFIIANSSGTTIDTLTDKVIPDQASAELSELETL